MDIFSAIILGIVEGITEFLPVSSTGHLLIAESLLGIHQSDAFNICIQIGPIVAVTLVFWKDIVRLLTSVHDLQSRDELIKLAACFSITAAAGLFAKKVGFELPETVLPIAIATFAGAGVILWAELRIKGKKLSETITWPVVFAVAIGQLLAAIFPGTSRSGAAVIAGILLGLSRPKAVQFAFIVGIPLMFAAGGLQIKEAIDAGQAAELLSLNTLIAFAVATVTAWATVIWLLRFVQHNTFIPFVWYRAALGIGLFILIAIGFLR